jgi:hypothetical protein
MQFRTPESFEILLLNEDWNWTLGCSNDATGEILDRRHGSIPMRTGEDSVARFRPTRSRDLGNFRNLVMSALN